MSWVRRIGVGLAALTALATAAAGACGLCYWRDMRIDTPRGIDESQYVRIGGIDQWVQIRGRDRRNPVVLWLNGGPGFSTIDDTYDIRSYEERYTIVMWDQRGEGRTYDRSGESVRDTMTIAQFTRDGVELTEYLQRRLQQDKVIILGHSWGSLLGVHLAQARPDLFAAYVGTGQLVSEQEGAGIAYPLLIARARAAGNALAEQQLRAAGPPPYSADVRRWIPLEMWAQALDPPSTEGTSGSPARLWLALRRLVGARGAVPGITPAVQFSMTTLWPEIVADDLGSARLRFEVPVIVIQGAEDITTPTVLARRCFDRLDAPAKRYVELVGTGHLAIFRAPRAFLRALDDAVRPLVAMR